MRTSAAIVRHYTYSAVVRKLRNSVKKPTMNRGPGIYRAKGDESHTSFGFCGNINTIKITIFALDFNSDFMHNSIAFVRQSQGNETNTLCIMFQADRGQVIWTDLEVSLSLTHTHIHTHTPIHYHSLSVCLCPSFYYVFSSVSVYLCMCVCLSALCSLSPISENPSLSICNASIMKIYVSISCIDGPWLSLALALESVDWLGLKLTHNVGVCCLILMSFVQAQIPKKLHSSVSALGTRDIGGCLRRNFQGEANSGKIRDGSAYFNFVQVIPDFKN